MIERIKPFMLPALLATSALTAPGIASAQEYFPPPAPPIRETIDANGVDLARGNVVSRSHSVSIGGPGGSGISWSRTITSTGAFRDSAGGSITSPGSGTLTVSIGNHSESFSQSGGNHISIDKTGATLTFDGVTGYTFITADGVIYIFEPLDPGKFQYSGNYALSQVTWPTGERQNFEYEYHEHCLRIIGGECVAMISGTRLVSVKSTTGYELVFNFQQQAGFTGINQTTPWMSISKVTARNMSVDPVSQSWPTLNLTGVASFADSLNRTTTYTYSGGVMTAVKRPGASANSTTYTYTSGKVSQVVNEGVTTNYAYADASNVRTTTISDAVTGDRLVKTDLTTMLITSDIDELGKITAYEYYPTSGLLKKVTAPEGNKAEYEYDARGNRTKTTATPKPGSPLSPIITQSSFPPSDVTQTWRCATATPAVVCNKPLTATDARGFVTNYAWDQTHGGAASVTLPAPTTGAVRPETRYAYTNNLFAQYRNSGGTLVNFATPVTRLTAVSACQTTVSCAGAADEVKSTISYTTANVLPTSVSSGSGDGTLTATTAYTYDTIGNRLTVDGPLSGTADTSRTRYDAVRQVIGEVGPDPDAAGSLKHRARRMTYNLDGQVTKLEAGTVNSQSDPDWANFVSLEAVETSYDANARPVTSKRMNGLTSYGVIQTNYDIIGRVDCQAVRMNTATFGSPPASACTLGTQGSAGPDRISKMTYDAVSRPTKVTVAFGTSDAADEVTATYSDNGKVTTVKDAENNLTTYILDGFDRVSRQRYPLLTQGSNASSTTDYDELAYDAASNVTSLRLRDAQSIGYTYDNLSRATLKNLPGSEPDVTYAYDNLSRLSSASQTGAALSFTYDALSRSLTQVGPQGTVTSQWDVAGRRTKLTYPGSGLFVDYDYLVTGDMTAIRENGATSGVGVLATYTYDDLGRRTSLTFGNGANQATTFDPVSRLANLTNNLSGTSNDLSATLAYNPASQIVSTVRTGDAYAWTGHFNQNSAGTANGLNQSTQVGAKALTYDTRGNVTAFGTRSFTYSSENMLLTAPGSTTLSYDPAMRLMQSVSGATTHKFAYDGVDRIAEYDGAGALLRRYVHGPGDDEPIVKYDVPAGTERHFLSSDERGSIISVTDSAGTVLGLNRYDEYGNPQSTNLGAFGYTGQTWIADANLWHYKARAYDPELGRFLQTDPIGYEGGFNLYAYVSNDPVNLVDPLGLIESNSAGGVWNCDQLPCTWQPDIVVTGKREPRYRDNTGWANFLRGAIEYAPGYEVYRCARRGCSAGEWLWAGASEAPILKLPKTVFKLAKLAKKTCGCLEEGTLVATPSGLVAIETIKVGDLVLAVDEKTGKIAPKPVTTLIRPDPKPLYQLALTDAGGEAETFHATDDHPWKVGKGWVETASLKSGDRINTGSGTNMVVKRLISTERVEPTFNLEVADWHTFMVGNDLALVHNACEDLLKELALREAKKSSDAERIMEGKIKDPNYPENIWGKYEYVHRGQDGSNITVHFWRNLQTGAEHGFKIK